MPRETNPAGILYCYLKRCCNCLQGLKEFMGAGVERDWLLTIFVSAGQSRKLGQRSEAIEAVRDGVLSADTRVMVRLASGERVQRRAIECEHLVDLFPAVKPDPIPEPIIVPEKEAEVETEPEAEIETAFVSEPEPEPEPEILIGAEAVSNPQPAIDQGNGNNPGETDEAESPTIAAPISEIEPEPVTDLEALPEDEVPLEAEPDQEQTLQPEVGPEQEVLTPSPDEEPNDDLAPQPDPEASTPEPLEPSSVPDFEPAAIEPDADGWEYEPPAATKSRGIGIKVGILGLLLALLAASAFLWFGGREQGGTRFLLSDVSGYEAPKSNAKSGDRLSYGQSVLVEPSDTDGWLRVVEGPYKGLYLPGTLLSREAPPQIDKSGSGMIASRDGMQLHIEPYETSEVVGSIPVGGSRFAQGIVQGGDGKAWLVFLIDEGDMPRAAFGLRDSKPSVEQATPTPTADAESAVPVETADVAAASASGMDSCAGIRRKLDRFTCQDPGLVSSQAEFSSAYSRAAARFGQAGQTLQPMTRFAVRIEQCGSPQCARTRYREQTSLLESLQPAARAAPVPAVREAARGATPRGNPGSWIRSDDYPARAMRAGEEGTVRFNLTIGPNGAVTACQVVGSSGSPTLDEATCRLVSRRARFDPAVDSTGTAVEGRYANAVRWRLPE